MANFYLHIQFIREIKSRPKGLVWKIIEKKRKQNLN